MSSLVQDKQHPRAKKILSGQNAFLCKENLSTDTMLVEKTMLLPTFIPRAKKQQQQKRVKREQKKKTTISDQRPQGNLNRKPF